jgi:RNA polymerase sigma-70 factor (ECF subfamily)
MTASNDAPARDANVRPLEPTPQMYLTPQRRHDMSLVADIVAGEPDAFDQLHALYRDRVFRFAMKRLRDAAEAEDVCQDVFLQIFRCIGSYQGRSSLLTWIFGVTHHQICRRHRRRSLESYSLDEPTAREPSVEQVPTDRKVEAVRVLADCQRVIDEQLNETQREVFELRYAENCTTREIAEKLGKSNQAIKISLFRSRQTLAGEANGLGALLSA